MYMMMVFSTMYYSKTLKHYYYYNCLVFEIHNTFSTSHDSQPFTLSVVVVVANNNIIDSQSVTDDKHEAGKAKNLLKYRTHHPSTPTINLLSMHDAPKESQSTAP